MVIVSLLINGSSLGLVYAKLRPHPTPACRSALLTVALGMLDQHVADFARVLGSDWFFKNADWEGVATLVPESRQDEGGPAGSAPMSDGISWADVFARLISTHNEAPLSLQANGCVAAQQPSSVGRLTPLAAPPQVSECRGAEGGHACGVGPGAHSPGQQGRAEALATRHLEQGE